MKEQWIKLHLEKGMPITELAKLSGKHENTLYLWKANYLKAGMAGLLDKSKAPFSHPNEYSEEVKNLIRWLRQEGLEKENAVSFEGRSNRQWLDIHQLLYRVQKER